MWQLFGGWRQPPLIEAGVAMFRKTSNERVRGLETAPPH